MGTKICKKKFLKSPQWLRNIKTAKPAFWKFYKPSQPQIINDGGWHFSFLRNAEEISEKIKTYSHMEYNKPEFTNVEKIQERIKNRTDIFDRNYKSNITYRKTYCVKYPCISYIYQCFKKIFFIK